MKKIALLADGWKRLITYAWVEGINRYIVNNGEEACVYHFNCLGSWSKDELYNDGEYTIYTLPDLHDFDGIILDANNIVDERQYTNLVTRIRESQVPAISIGRFVDGLYYAGVDNSDAIKRIMEHVYTKHGARSFVFAGGPRESGENMLRTQAFEQFIEEHGLLPEKNPVWYNDFELSTGVQYFEDVMRLEMSLPDAYICANDNIAAGLIDTAQKHGYRIPEDFIVTGFDNMDKAAYFCPQISTVGHERENISETCMQLLSDIWDKKPVKQLNYVKAQSYFSESCGCPTCTKMDYRQFAKNSVITQVEKQKFDEELIWFEGRLSSAETFEEIFEYIGQYFQQLSCDGITLVVDERLFEMGDEEIFNTGQYDRRHLVVVYSDEKFVHEERLRYSKFRKEMQKDSLHNVYMYTPIHARDLVFGFSILKNGRFLYDNPYFYGVHSLVNRVIGDLYRKIQLRRMNDRLSELYNKDMLTGIYNRIAYNDMVEPMFEKACADGKQCLVLFADCDHFKQINDTLGHEAGDKVLKQVGKILKEQCPEKGRAFRYGGDEFVMFMPLDESDDPEEIKNKVIKKFASRKIAISVGAALTQPGDDRNMDDYMREADQDMYEAKRRREEG